MTTPLPRGPAGPRPDTGPVFGTPGGFRFDGAERWVWWGQDENGEDVVATRGGRLVTFGSAAECRAAFPVLTIASGDPAVSGEEPDPVAADLGPAQEWVRGQRLSVPLSSALDLWNWGIDAAYSTGQSFAQRARRHDRCYDKLMAHRSPYLFGLDEYRPVWSAGEIAVLRQTLGRAVHVLRAALA
ncbi:hypothetical protein [Actinoplanes teichomyceticus]|uniref:Uncharacterized protein n=1 Tax=Actinoplanes teichomyceticus TaxID=1867 RepID=A0A561WQN7_ACTTI|nr:hypothetical protein [Actinoplanes teichomyceticus]TWG26183.1 hypothetical protein FHX34_1011161 [Actinoplanes teichomyceticus]GIF11261.1 hypothetical protein Ate01nite_12930 [Actinoplanes teichomyceticus]